MTNLDAISKISLQNNVEKIGKKESDGGEGFLSVLKDTMNEVNTMQKKGEEAVASIATGSVRDLHQAAITIDKAELSMKMMLEVRNKALSAYKEVLRTQV